MKHRLTAAVAALALATAACGSGASTGAPASSGPVKLAVWIMDGSVTQDLLKTFETRYEAAHPKTDLDIQIQAWDGIGEQVTAALASNDAPDVIEVGNTQVAQYAASGGVNDLTAKVADLKGEDWLPGLAEPGNIDGKQYGIPWYAANRVVVYNKDLFAKAGDRRPAEDQGRVAKYHRKAQQGRQPGHLPARPDLVHPRRVRLGRGRRPGRQGGRHSGRARWTRPQALAGMEFYKKLQALGKGPKDADEAKPPQARGLRQGQDRPDHRRPRRRRPRS